MKLRTSTRVASLALVTALLAACGTGGSTTGDDDGNNDNGNNNNGSSDENGDGGSDGNGDDADPSDDAAPPDGDGVTITLWLAGDEDTPEALEEWLVSEFESQNDGATLHVQRIAWGELLDRANQALPDPNNTPDVIEMGNTQVPTYTSVGAFENLSPWIGDFGNIGPEGFIEAGTYDGTVYAVPYYWGSRHIFFDQDAFTDAGIEVPTTLEEFSDAALALSANGDASFSGFWLPGQDWRNGISWIFAHGGDIATLDGDRWVGALSSPESIAGLTQLQQLYLEATTAPQDGRDAEPWVPFNNGESAMFMAPSWARWSVAEDKADGLGAIALPGVDGGAAPVFAGGSNIGISAQSQHPELAAEVLKLIFSDEYQTMLAENGLGPARSEFTSLMGDDPFALAAIAAAENSKLTPASAEWAAVEEATVMEEFFGQIAGGADVASAAAAADAQLEDLLNR